MDNARLCGPTWRIRPGTREWEARQERCAGPSPRRPLLILVALLVLALADVLFRGVDSMVDLLVVLMVGVALGDPRYFVDSLVGLLRVLLGVGLRLLLQVAELAHAVLLCLTGPGLPPGRVPGAPTPTPGTDAQAPPAGSECSSSTCSPPRLCATPPTAMRSWTGWRPRPGNP